MTKNKWYTTNEILVEHSHFQIRQIYLWFITLDKKIVIVGRNDKFQFPGGKPESGESQMDTICRELFEEAGIILTDYKETPNFFVYYVIEEDPNWNNDTYLQIRYVMNVASLSDEISLSANERVDDTDQIEKVEFVNLYELPNYIPWTKDIEEYKMVLSLVNGKK